MKIFQIHTMFRSTCRAMFAAGLLVLNPSAHAVPGPIAWQAAQALTQGTFDYSGAQHSVAVLPDGRVAVSFVVQDGPPSVQVRPLRIYIRENSGQWNFDADLNGAFSSDGIWTIGSPPLHATDDGRLVTAYRIPDHATSGGSSVLDSIIARVRGVNGIWSYDVMEADGPATDDCADMQGEQVGSSGSNLLVAWTCIVKTNGNETDRVVHARMHNGTSWSAIETLSNAVGVTFGGIMPMPNGGFAVLTQLKQDTDPNTNDSVGGVYIRDSVGNWSNHVFPNSKFVFSIDTASDGSVVVVYTDYVSGVLFSGRSPQGGWGPAEIVTPPIGGSWPIVRLLPDGRTVAAWASFASVHAAIRPVNGVWGTPTSLSNVGGNSLRLAVDDLGNSSVVWSGADGANTRVRTSTLPTGSNTWSVTRELSGAIAAQTAEPAMAAAGSIFGLAWIKKASNSTYFDVYAMSGTGSDINEPPTLPQTPFLPTLSGTFGVDFQVVCTSPTWEPGPVTLSYQWLRDYENPVEIPGATSASYKLTLNDYKKTVACRVTATNAAGPSSSTSVWKSVGNGSAPVATSKPAITGTPKVGKTLKCSPGKWSPPFDYTYKWQWYRGNKKLSGATGKVYVVSLADKGKKLSCRLTAGRTGYLTGVATSSQKLIE